MDQVAAMLSSTVTDYYATTDDVAALIAPITPATRKAPAQGQGQGQRQAQRQRQAQGQGQRTASGAAKADMADEPSGGTIYELVEFKNATDGGQTEVYDSTSTDKTVADKPEAKEAVQMYDGEAWPVETDAGDLAVGEWAAQRGEVVDADADADADTDDDGLYDDDYDYDYDYDNDDAAADVALGAWELDLRVCWAADVIAPILSAARAIAERDDVRLTTRVDDDLPGVSVDERALQESVSNVIDNALKFVHLRHFVGGGGGADGGAADKQGTSAPIQPRSSCTPIDHISHLGTTNAKGEGEGEGEGGSDERIELWVDIHVREALDPKEGCVGVDIVVTDNGPGFAAGEVEDAFGRGWRGALPEQVHMEGSGLGLPIARDLMRAMGGDIRVKPPKSGGRTEVVVRCARG